MNHIFSEPVRLADARPACGFALACAVNALSELPAWLRAVGDWISVHAFDGDAAMQLILRACGGKIRSSVRIRLRAADAFADADALHHSAEALCLHLTRNFPSLSTDAIPIDLPDAPPDMMLRRRRIPCRLNRQTPCRLDAPKVYFPPIEAVDEDSRCAVWEFLRTQPNAAIALDLIPIRRTADERRLFEAALFSPAEEAFARAYRAMQGDDAFAFALHFWGMPFTLPIRTSLGALPLLPDDSVDQALRHDPWELMRLLKRNFSDTALAGIAHSLTPQELAQFFSSDEKEVPT